MGKRLVKDKEGVGRGVDGRCWVADEYVAETGFCGGCREGILRIINIMNGFLRWEDGTRLDWLLDRLDWLLEGLGPFIV